MYLYMHACMYVSMYVALERQCDIEESHNNNKRIFAIDKLSCLPLYDLGQVTVLFCKMEKSLYFFVGGKKT